MQQKVNDVLSRINVGERLSKLAVSSTGFVFDPQTGQSFTLNHSGLTALDALKRTASTEYAARALADTYKIPLEIAETSLDAFLVQLGRYL
ncbi:MAG: PqqD family protein [Candidatus Obscuribacterales bacterium]|jgi:hypothetical protein